MGDGDAAELRRDVVIAGHTGDVEVVRRALRHDDPTVREAAYGAMARLGLFTTESASVGIGDPHPRVRGRVAELCAELPGFDLGPLLDDDDPMVVEMAAWSCGEHETPLDHIVPRLAELCTSHEEALVREAAVAALGAIGDERGLSAILRACDDKPTVRRRAVLALAPFDGPEVQAALKNALDDRDWQVRQAAEDLLG
jgi:HEAT repeat protein